MNALVERARAAMNLILAASLVLVWAVARPTLNPVQIAKELLRTSYKLQEIGHRDDIANKKEIQLEGEKYKDAIKRLDDLLAQMSNLNELTVGIFAKSLDLEQIDSMLDKVKIKEKEIDNVDPRRIDQLLVNDLTTPNPRIPLFFSIPTFTLEFEFESPEKKGNAKTTNIKITKNSSSTNADTETIKYYQSLRNQLIELHHEVGGQPDAKVEDLSSIARREVRVPSLDQTISADKATIIIIMGLIGPLLYLASICLTMRQLSDSTQHEGIDWIFFHRGWRCLLGPAIGCLWLASPILITIVSKYFHDLPPLSVFIDVPYVRSDTPWPYISLLGLVTAFAIGSAIASQLKYNSAFNRMALVPEQTLPPSQPDDALQTISNISKSAEKLITEFREAVQTLGQNATDHDTKLNKLERDVNDLNSKLANKTD